MYIRTICRNMFLKCLFKNPAIHLDSYGKRVHAHCSQLYHDIPTFMCNRNTKFYINSITYFLQCSSLGVLVASISKLMIASSQQLNRIFNCTISHSLLPIHGQSCWLVPSEICLLFYNPSVSTVVQATLFLHLYWIQWLMAINLTG